MASHGRKSMASTNQQHPEFLSLRDYCAAQALIAIIPSDYLHHFPSDPAVSKEHHAQSTEENIAIDAYRIADAMLKISSRTLKTSKKPS